MPRTGRLSRFDQCPHGHAHETPAHHRGPEGADPEEAGVQDGVGIAPGVAGIGPEEAAARRKEAGDEEGRQDVPAQGLEAEDQGGEAQAGQGHARPVDGRHVLSGHPGHMAQDQDEADGGDGQVDEEDPAPVGEGDDGAAEDRADHRAEEGGHGQDGEGADELGLRGGAQQDQPADWTHEGAGRALGDPGGHERRKGSGQAAGGGGQGVEEDGRDEDPTGAEPVGRPAADRQEDGGGEHVEGDGEVEPQGLDAQGDGHGGQGVGQDRGVEGLHEQGPADDGRDPPVRRLGDGRGRLWEGHVDRGT